MKKLLSAKRAAKVLNVNAKTAGRRAKQAIASQDPEVFYSSGIYLATEATWRRLFEEYPVQRRGRPSVKKS